VNVDHLTHGALKKWGVQGRAGPSSCSGGGGPWRQGERGGIFSLRVNTPLQPPLQSLKPQNKGERFEACNGGWKS